MSGPRYWHPHAGEEVIATGMALDGLRAPGVVVGFVDYPGHPRHGQPIVRWASGLTGAVNPGLLWPADYARRIATGEAVLP